MKVVIQRVKRASVHIDKSEVATIQSGLLLFLGIHENDTEDDLAWLSTKIVKLRIFADEIGKMNLSVKETEKEILLVSQFKLYANTKKGNRPSFIAAAKPEKAIPLYEKMIKQLQDDIGNPIKTGVFGADMQIELINDGPVTIIIDTQNKE